MKKILLAFSFLLLFSFAFFQSNATQCTGTPVAGTISSTSTDTLCIGEFARLKLNNFTTDSGITIRWQQMPSGSNTWLNAAGNDSSITLVSQALTGTTQFRCYLTCVNSGLSDTTLAFTVFSPGIVSVDNDTVCVPGVYDILSHGIGTTTWYPSMISPTVLSSTNTLNANIPFDTVFYATSTFFERYLVGPIDKTIGGGAGGATTNFANGLVIKTFSDFILDTVFVYPTAAGAIRIIFTDSVSNTIVDSLNITFTTPQINTKVPLPLNWSIPAGHTYLMRTTQVGTVPSLFRNTAGGNGYPYTVPNIMAISRNINNQANAYYFFYDWRMHRGCTSSRVAIPIHIGSLLITANTSADSVCNGLPVTLTGFGASTYQWNPGGVSANPAIFNPTTTTTYTVIGSVGTGCSDSTMITVIVHDPDTFTASSVQDSVCAGGAATLSATGSLTYNWMPGNLSGANVTGHPSVSTTYTVTGTNSYGCGSTQMVHVDTYPISLTLNSTPDTICPGALATLDVTGALNYVWNPGSINGASVDVSPTSSTTFTVTGTESHGCTKTDSIRVIVRTINVTGTSAKYSICIGDSVLLHATGANTYQWAPDGQTGSNVYVHPITPTIYTVTGTNTFLCTDDDTVSIDVSDVPITSFTYLDSLGVYYFTNTSQNGTSYTWMFGDSINSNAVNPTYHFSSSDTFYVYLVATSGCGSDTTVQAIYVAPQSVTNLENTKQTHSLSVSPNPFSDETRITFTNSTSERATLLVYDPLGREVSLLKNELVDAGKHIIKFNSKSLPPGFYFCKLQMGNSSEMVKMVIVK